MAHFCAFKVEFLTQNDCTKVGDGKFSAAGSHPWNEANGAWELYRRKKSENKDNRSIGRPVQKTKSCVSLLLRDPNISDCYFKGKEFW